MDKLYQSEKDYKEITELGFTYIEDGCDGLCHECDRMFECEAYKKIKDACEKLCP